MARKLILAALAAALALPPAADAGTARDALDEALALFAPAAPRAARASANESREATLVLRDLATRLSELRPAERRLAKRLLARPTSPRALNRYVVVARRACDRRICVWWSQSGRDAPPPADRDRDGVPNQVERTQRILSTVWRREIGDFGYLPPLADGSSRSPDERLDVYLTDVGQYGLYGYCASDDPRLSNARARGVWAFCVFDDDYARAQYAPAASGVRALRVTAAHEFFHAVQSRYDFREDRFLLESTAVWMEDEVYDGVNDNLAWLSLGGPLMPENTEAVGPWLPLDVSPSDLADPLYTLNYGSWIFFRFLSERTDRKIVREIWERARKRTSVRAILGAVGGRGLDFRKTFAEFGVWNTAPSAFYSEGSLYPVPGTAVLQPGTQVARDMYHLANDYLEVPVAGSGATTLSLSLDLPAPEQPGLPEANVVVFDAAGVHRFEIALDAAGNALAAIPVGGATKVVLVLTNAGSDTVCGQSTFYACGGTSLDDVLDGYLVGAALS
jgi:hypothetical protein